MEGGTCGCGYNVGLESEVKAPRDARPRNRSPSQPTGIVLTSEDDGRGRDGYGDADTPLRSAWCGRPLPNQPLTQWLIVFPPQIQTIDEVDVASRYIDVRY